MELDYLYELYFSWINEGRSQNEINELSTYEKNKN